MIHRIKICYIVAIDGAKTATAYGGFVTGLVDKIPGQPGPIHDAQPDSYL